MATCAALSSASAEMLDYLSTDFSVDSDCEGPAALPQPGLTDADADATPTPGYFGIGTESTSYGTLDKPLSLSPSSFLEVAQQDLPLKEKASALWSSATRTVTEPVGQFFEGLTQGRPGARGGISDNLLNGETTKYQLANAMAMTDAQSLGVNLHNLTNAAMVASPAAAGFASAGLDFIASLDLSDKPYKEEIYGRKAGDAGIAGLAKSFGSTFVVASRAVMQPPTTTAPELQGFLNSNGLPDLGKMLDHMSSKLK